MPRGSALALSLHLLVCLVLSQVSAEEFLLSSSSAAISESGQHCPEDQVVFTCLGSQLSHDSFLWFINADPLKHPTSTSFSLANISAIGTPYVLEVSNVTITIVTVGIKEGQAVFVNSTLVTTIRQGQPSSVGCGSFTAKNELTIICNSSSNAFILQPSTQSCKDGGTATFKCRPETSLTTATLAWTVNGSSSEHFPGFTVTSSGPTSQLLVRGCVPEWAGTRIQCVLIVSATVVKISNTALLSVKLSVLWTYIAIGLGVVISCVFFCFTCTCFCCSYHRHIKNHRNVGYVRISSSPPSPMHSKRNRERIDDERRERDTAIQSIKRLVSPRYTNVDVLPDLGSRLQKYWCSANLEGTPVIITRAPLPKNCKLTLDIEDTATHARSLTKLIRHLQAHDKEHLLHHVQEIIADHSDNPKIFVLVIQPRACSLRDLIYGVENDLDWSDKYSSGEALSADRISCYGKQILNGLTFLYQQGLAFHGHVKTGNIFVTKEDKCQLGGYENVLLGYRSQLYREATEQNLFDDIDAIMFGHVIYEMATGMELSPLIPEEDDYTHVKDMNCMEVLQYIFKQKDGKIRSIQKIKNHEFFNKKLLYRLLPISKFNFRIFSGHPPAEVKSLLKLVFSDTSSVNRKIHSEKELDDLSNAPGDDDPLLQV